MNADFTCILCSIENSIFNMKGVKQAIVTVTKGLVLSEDQLEKPVCVQKV